MLKESTGSFDDFFHVRNVSTGCHLLVLSTRFLLCSTQAVAAVSALHNVVNLAHPVGFSLHRLFLHFRVVFCVRRI